MASTGLGGYGFGLAPLFQKGAGEIWLWVRVSQGKATDLTGELARVGEQGEGMGEGGGRNMSAIARQVCTRMDVSVDSQCNHFDGASPGLQLRWRQLRMRQVAAAVVAAAVYAVADVAAADVIAVADVAVAAAVDAVAAVADVHVVAAVADFADVHYKLLHA